MLALRIFTALVFGVLLIGHPACYADIETAANTDTNSEVLINDLPNVNPDSDAVVAIPEPHTVFGLGCLALAVGAGLLVRKKNG